MVVVRAGAGQIDLLSFPRRAPAPEASLEVPAQAAATSTAGAAASSADAGGRRGAGSPRAHRRRNRQDSPSAAPARRWRAGGAGDRRAGLSEQLDVVRRARCASPSGSPTSSAARRSSGWRSSSRAPASRCGPSASSEPGRLGQGSRRAADGARRRRLGRAHARQDHHRLDERQHRRRLLDGRRGARLSGGAGDAGNVSARRKQIAAAYGTELIFSSELEGSDGAIRLCRQLVAEYPEHYFYPDQYSNESNPRAHYLAPGARFWEQTGGRVTHFVAGIGTTGTIMGTGRRLKEYRRDIEIWRSSPTTRCTGSRGSSTCSRRWCRHLAARRHRRPAHRRWAPTRRGTSAERLARDEGLFVGHSAGAAVAGAMRMAAPGPGRRAGRHRDAAARSRRSLLRAPSPPGREAVHE